jgi:hypothetical protein
MRRHRRPRQELYAKRLRQTGRPTRRAKPGLGSIPVPVVWGALGVSVLAAVVYLWPRREVRMV